MTDLHTLGKAMRDAQPILEKIHDTACDPAHYPSLRDEIREWSRDLLAAFDKALAETPAAAPARNVTADEHAMLMKALRSSTKLVGEFPAAPPAPADVAGKEPGQLAYETFFRTRSRLLWENAPRAHRELWAAVEAAVRAAYSPSAPADVAGLVEEARRWPGKWKTSSLVNRMAAALTAQAGEIERLKDENMGLAAERDAARKHVDWRMERADAAEARVTELERALDAAFSSDGAEQKDQTNG